MFTFIGIIAALGFGILTAMATVGVVGLRSARRRRADAGGAGTDSAGTADGRRC